MCIRDSSSIAPDEVDNKSGMTPAEQLNRIYETIPGLIERKKRIYASVCQALLNEGIKDVSLSLIHISIASFTYNRYNFVVYKILLKGVCYVETEEIDSDFACCDDGSCITAHRNSFCCRTGPVSYTHLDVYKRQADGTPDELTRRRYQRFATSGAGMILSLIHIFQPGETRKFDVTLEFNRI